MMKYKKILVIIGLMVFIMLSAVSCKNGKKDSVNNIDIEDEQVELDDIIKGEDDAEVTEKDTLEDSNTTNSTGSTGNTTSTTKDDKSDKEDVVIDNNTQGIVDKAEEDEEIDNVEPEKPQEESWSPLF